MIILNIYPQVGSQNEQTEIQYGSMMMCDGSSDDPYAI